MKNAILVSKMIGLLVLTLFIVLVPPMLCGVFSFIIGYNAMLLGLPRWTAIVVSIVLAIVFGHSWGVWSRKYIHPTLRSMGEKILQ